MSEQRTSSDWFELIAAWKDSGMSGAVWCRENRVVYHCFLYWRRRCEFLSGGEKALVRQMPRSSFTEVVCSDVLTAEVNGVRLHLERGFDPVLLREAITAIRGA